MKTKVLTGSILLCMLLMICSFDATAVSDKNYIHDTKMENNKIVSKVIYMEMNGYLAKRFKYEFSYNDEGKVSGKEGFRWDSKRNSWEPCYKIKYEYNKGENKIRVDCVTWNKKDKAYTVNQQTQTMSMEDYDSIFS